MWTDKGVGKYSKVLNDLHELAAKQRDQRVDMLYLGKPDQELVEARNAILELTRKYKNCINTLLNVEGLLDTPVARRRFKGNDFYQEVLDSVREALYD